MRKNNRRATKHIMIAFILTHLSVVGYAQVYTKEVLVDETYGGQVEIGSQSQNANLVVNGQAVTTGNVSVNGDILINGTSVANGDLTINGSLGKENVRMIILEDFPLIDGASTPVLALKLPVGSYLGGSYAVKVRGVVRNGDQWSGSHVSKYYEGYLNWSQGGSANNSSGFITGTITSSPVSGTTDNANLGTIAIAGARSGTNNSDHTISIFADGSATYGVSLYFSGIVEVYLTNFKSFEIN